MTNFLPEGYTIPEKASGYMRFQQGLNSMRVLSSAVVGYEYFTEDNKVVRSKEYPTTTPNIKNGGYVKAFWAFVVWNYNAKKIQLLEVTQKSIMISIKSLVDNPKWGDPKMYDIGITRTGEGLETEYTVQGEPPIAEPAKEIIEAYNNKQVNLEALFTNDDPFAMPGKPQETINIEDIPFN